MQIANVRIRKHPLKPVNGYLSLPNLPGLGREWDEAKIEKSEGMA